MNTSRVDWHVEGLIKSALFISMFVWMFIAYVIIPKPTQAVIPPDFIFNIGAQVAQFFSIAMLFFSVVAGTIFQFFKGRLHSIKHKRIVVGVAIILIISTSALGAFFYAQYKQKFEYQEWLEESQINLRNDI